MNNKTTFIANYSDISCLISLREAATARQLPLEIKTRLECLYKKALNKTFFAAISRKDDYAISTAFLSVSIHEQLDVGIIFNLFTYPEYRNNGLAQECISQLIEIGKKHRLSYLEAETNLVSRAILFKLGFCEMKNAPFILRYYYESIARQLGDSHEV